MLHRSLITVVQAIIRNTLKESKTLAEAAYVVNGRITALSQAYTLLADAAWESASLAKIIRAQSPLDSPRVSVEGCEINLLPSAAQHFAMILHELGTNALKYGALSAGEGRIFITGQFDDQDFVFVWKEQGGPPVLPPARKGFGSIMLLDAAGNSASRRSIIGPSVLSTGFNWI